MVPPRPAFAVMCHPSMCTDEWHPAASTLCPSVFPAKNAGGKSQLCSKMKLKRSFPENFLTTGGHFKHKTYHVTAQGWLKKEIKKERR